MAAFLVLPAGLWVGGAWWKWLLTAVALFLAAVVADVKKDEEPRTIFSGEDDE